jgi:hypothetical protein
MQLQQFNPVRSVMVAEALPASPSITNVHLVSMTATDFPHVTTMGNLYVPFHVDASAPYGGHRVTTHIVDGRQAGIALRAFVNRDAERVAAQAVYDAIAASGLLTAQLPANDRQRPEVGHTRLYLDRRNRFLEFETAQPPAIVQPVLQALASYEAIARRH